MDRWGHFDLEGAMVAYGRDLETDVPNGSGRIDVRSTSSKLTYNPIFIMNLFSMVPPEARLTRVSYHVY